MPSKSRDFHFGMRVIREEGFNLEEEGRDMTMIDMGVYGLCPDVDYAVVVGSYRIADGGFGDDSGLLGAVPGRALFIIVD